MKKKLKFEFDITCPTQTQEYAVCNIMNTLWRVLNEILGAEGQLSCLGNDINLKKTEKMIK